MNYHWWDLAKAAGLSTLLSIGAEPASNDGDRPIQVISNGGHARSTMLVSRSYRTSSSAQTRGVYQSFENNRKRLDPRSAISA
jgi:hypothetical protein